MPRRSLVNTTRLSGLFDDNVATRRQLIRLGLGPSTIYRRCHDGGPWQRLLPGVILLHSGEPTRRQLVRAALLRTGPLTVVTGLEAVRRYGVRKVPDDSQVHILVPHGMRVTGRDFLLVERTERAWDEFVVDGFPLAAPPRALIDGARRERRTDIVRAMVADAVQRKICSVDDLAKELVLLRLRGTALPRRVLAEVADGVRSVAEAWGRTLFVRSGFPAPQWNAAVRAPSGGLLGVVDAWWDDVALAWEIDSKEFHLGPKDYERTVRRHSALTAAGVIVVHTVPSRLLREPKAVLSELRGAYEFAARRSRPPVLTALWRPAA